MSRGTYRGFLREDFETCNIGFKIYELAVHADVIIKIISNTFNLEITNNNNSLKWERFLKFCFIA